MFDDLKKQVLEANLDLAKHKLALFTWGNASAIDRSKGIIAIKPSGVPYETMNWKDIVLVDMDGKVVDSSFKPSSDTPTHLVLYKQFSDVGGIVHTHSEWATVWAQSGLSIPALGTTHADYFYGDIPCTRALSKEEINGDYEKATGEVIVETFHEKKIDPMAIPGVVIQGHGPFSWGTDAHNAVHNAVVLEQVAKMAHHTLILNNKSKIDQFLLDKHYKRKHGPGAYYGQH